MTDKTTTEQAKEMLAFLCETFQVYVSEKGGDMSDLRPFYYGFVAGLISTATDLEEVDIRLRCAEEMSDIVKSETGEFVGGNSGN